MRDLIAAERFVYANRRLKAGDYFTARTLADANALVALGKAAREGGGEAKPDKVDAVDGLKKLRADYLEVVGKKAFSGWGAADLQRRIDEALK